MADFSRIDALFPCGDRLLWAAGPWAEMEGEPAPSLFSERPLFLRPSFDPRAPRIWLAPALWGEISMASLLQDHVVPSTPLRLQWEEANAAKFFEAFGQVQSQIAAGSLNKAVPVHVWKGRLLEPIGLSTLWTRLFSNTSNLNPYFLHFDEKVLLGLTPELLFSNEAGVLKTQAVAGSSSVEMAAQLAKSEKDFREHECVRQFLLQQLKDLGKIDLADVDVKTFANIAHLVSECQVVLNENLTVHQLLEIFHPTPALGVSPRNDVNLDFQLDIRKQLGVDPSFGAPVGYVWKNKMCFWVGIRNVLIQGDRLQLPTGCGVISSSRAELEWDELKLKRRAVCKNLNLAM